jgi:iron(III) transport system permease protein
MQSAAGRGPGAALGVIAVVVVAIATYIAFKIAERERGLKSREMF